MKKRQLFILLAVITALVLFSACGGLDQSIWTPDPVAPPAIPEGPPPDVDSDWAPGTYVGVGTGGYGGDITVEVEIDEDGRIASITVTDHRETQAFLAMAESIVLGTIISAQSTDVDTFAGATLSSQALINAVEDALSGA